MFSMEIGVNIIQQLISY